MSKPREALDLGCCVSMAFLGIAAALTIVKLTMKIFSWIWS